MAELDLLIYTYQTLIPNFKQKIGSNMKFKELLDESSLDNLFSFERRINSLLAEFPQIRDDIVLLYFSKLFIKINEQEVIDLNLASKAVECLKNIKNFKPEIDIKTCAEDLISNLDTWIASATFEELFEWSKFIESDLQDMVNKDTFIPVLSIRIKSMLWNLIQVSDMDGHVKLAKALFECGGFKFIGLNEMTDIIVDQCLEFLETINDLTGIERSLGNTVASDKENSSILLSILSSIEINSNEIKTRLNEMKIFFGNIKPFDRIREIGIKQVDSLSDIHFEDVIIYQRQKNTNGVETLIRKGRLSSGAEVAVKIYTFSEGSNKKRYEKERKVLQELSREKKCFLVFYGGFLEGNSLVIVTELCEKTLDEDLIKRRADNNPYTLDEKLDIMSQLLEGFNYLNIKKMYHRDIKPENIMFSSEGLIKIIDFNTIANEDENKLADNLSEVSIEGTKNWMSPEVLKGLLTQSNPNETIKLNTEKSDVFSLGLVFLSLFTFNELNGKNCAENNEILQKIAEESIEHQVSKDLIKKMLSLDPENRPTFSMALAELPSKRTHYN